MDTISVCLITMTAIICSQLLQKLKFSAIISAINTRQISLQWRRNKSDSGVTRVVPRVYTRTGDNGSSALFTGERRAKDDLIFEALGSTDELSSAIGLAREFVANGEVSSQLEQIQCVLQDLQSAIATPRSTAKESQIAKTKWNINYLLDLEQWIDNHSISLPPLKNFILPSGGKASAALHVSRAVCRRAERRVVPLLADGLELPILQYLNRLSSYLFTVARVCAASEGREEKIYRRQKSSNTLD